jgi:Flp pilus assembly protein TadG
MWRLIRRRAGDERGAVIVLMIGFSVALVGMAALVIDVGSILDEKAQLQNGADAAALGVAQNCAVSTDGTCDKTIANSLANSNARDNSSDVSVGVDMGTKLVTAKTTTRTGTSSILPYYFGQALTGVNGRTHSATASATWAVAGGALVLPFAISPCNKAQLQIGVATVIYVNSFGVCPGHLSSGGFGWLDMGCQTIGYVDTWVNVNTGRSGPNCLHPLQNTVVLLPVTDNVTGGGNSAKYHVIGFAALRLTGWEMPGDHSTPAITCPSNTCIAGTFVNFVATSTISGGTDFGVYRVFLKS